MVIILAADGFEEIELITPLDMLIRAGIETKTAAVTEPGQNPDGTNAVTGGHGIRIIADMSIGEVDMSKCDMLVLPGGGAGVKNLKADARAIGLVKKAAAEGKYIAAICAAPSVLQELGLIENIKFTCYPGIEDLLGSGIYTGGDIEIAGKIITSKAAGTAVSFGAALISALKGEDEAKKVTDAIYYK